MVWKYILTRGSLGKHVYLGQYERELEMNIYEASQSLVIERMVLKHDNSRRHTEKVTK